MRKFPGALYERSLANRVRGVTRKGENRSKRQKANQKPKKFRNRKKTIKHKKDSGFDFQIRWIKPIY